MRSRGARRGRGESTESIGAVAVERPAQEVAVPPSGRSASDDNAKPSRPRGVAWVTIARLPMQDSASPLEEGVRSTCSAADVEELLLPVLRRRLPGTSQDSPLAPRILRVHRTSREPLQRSLENAVEPTGQLSSRSTATDRACRLMRGRRMPRDEISTRSAGETCLRNMQVQFADDSFHAV